MSPAGPDSAVVALGGNALLRRGEPLEAANQAREARDAALILSPDSVRHQLVITLGNGPQVGLLALMSDAYTETEPYPLAFRAGQIGYVLEMQLDNCIDHQDMVAVITRVVRDGDDPAFRSPSKFIGPLYTEAQASDVADWHGWTV
jgi:carbamate kinase